MRVKKTIKYFCLNNIIALACGNVNSFASDLTKNINNLCTARNITKFEAEISSFCTNYTKQFVITYEKGRKCDKTGKKRKKSCK